MLTFAERERNCEREFDAAGPFWHLYTNGKKIDNILCNNDDFKIAMVTLAVVAVLFKKVRIITFELMSNHIHIILNGDEEACQEFFEKFKRRLRRVLRSKGKVVDWERFQAEILKIDNLTALRNEIIYVNRNAFVANPDYTPFSYPWGGGCAYFSPIFNSLPAKTLNELGFNRGRELTHFRDIRLLDELKFVDDIVHIPSFCRIDIGESMFRDARSYFNSLTRNAEAFSEIASRLKELHFKYNASNQQIRRLLKLNLEILDELFPSVK